MSNKNERMSEASVVVGPLNLFLGSEGDSEIELESSPEAVISDWKNRDRNPLIQGHGGRTVSPATCSRGDTKSARRGRQGESISGRKAGGQAVSWFDPRCL